MMRGSTQRSEDAAVARGFFLFCLYVAIVAVSVAVWLVAVPLSGKIGLQGAVILLLGGGCYIIELTRND